MQSHRSRKKFICFPGVFLRDEKLPRGLTFGVLDKAAAYGYFCVEKTNVTKCRRVCWRANLPRTAWGRNSAAKLNGFSRRQMRNGARSIQPTIQQCYHFLLSFGLLPPALHVE